MSEKDKLLSGIKIKNDSIFSLDELYKMMYRWFENKGFQFAETEYRKHGTGDYLEIMWYAEKPLDAYAKVTIEIAIMVLGLEKVEIEIEGVKSKSNKCGVEMKIDVNLIRDYQDKFGPKIRKLYETFIIKKRLDDYEHTVLDAGNSLISEIKSFLKLHEF